MFIVSNLKKIMLYSCIFVSYQSLYMNITQINYVYCYNLCAVYKIL